MEKDGIFSTRSRYFLLGFEDFQVVGFFRQHDSAIDYIFAKPAWVGMRIHKETPEANLSKISNLS